MSKRVKNVTLKLTKDISALIPIKAVDFFIYVVTVTLSSIIVLSLILNSFGKAFSSSFELFVILTVFIIVLISVKRGYLIIAWRRHFEPPLLIAFIYFILLVNRVGTPVWEGRDPTSYSFEARLFQISGKFLIPITQDIFKGYENGTYDGPAHSVVNGNIENQFMHGLPIINGVIARILGDNWIFLSSILFSSLSGLVIYRILINLEVHANLALFGQMMLYLAAPVLYTSTTLFSEPIALFFNLVFLHTLLTISKDSFYLKFIVALSAILSSCVTRIDSPIILILVNFLYLLHRKPILQKERVMLLILNLIPLLFWWIDLSKFNTEYLKTFELQSRLILILIFIELVLILSPIRIYFATSRLIQKFIVLFIVSIGLLNVIAAQSIQQIHPVNSGVLSKSPEILSGWPNNTNVFGFNSVEWLGWYFGSFIVLVVLFVATLSFVLKSDLIQNTHKHISFGFLLFFSYFAIYPGIAADQPWGSRKLVPFLIPLFIILFFLQVNYLVSFRNFAQFLVPIIVVISMISILIPTSKIIKSSEQRGFLPVVQEFCKEAADFDGLIVDQNLPLTLSLRVWCNVPTIQNLGSLEIPIQFRNGFPDKSIGFVSTSPIDDPSYVLVWSQSSGINKFAVEPGIGQVAIGYQGGQSLRLYLYNLS